MNVQETDDKSRKFNYANEELILLASTILTLELSRGKTSNEIELIALILQNVASQLATIADMRVLSDDINGEDILPFLPII
ncbi:MAG: hypothetical protein R3Y09_04615 [Clostridia bacterium]